MKGRSKSCDQHYAVFQLPAFSSHLNPLRTSGVAVANSFEVHIQAAAEGVAVPGRNDNPESRSCILFETSFCQWQRVPGKSYTAASASPKPGGIKATKTMNQTTKSRNKSLPSLCMQHPSHLSFHSVSAISRQEERKCEMWLALPHSPDKNPDGARY